MNFSDLIAYFESLATRHRDIRHSQHEKHFFRFEVDEVLAGINRTDVSYPMLVLEGYNFDFTDKQSDNLIKNRSGAFILLGMVSDITDYGQVHQVWDALERIGDDIIARIRHDKQSRLVPVVRDFNLESVQASLLVNAYGNNAGIRYTFTISSPEPFAMNPEKWLE
jgi:hypothetical protein